MKIKLWLFCLLIFMSCQNADDTKFTKDKIDVELNQFSTDTNFVKGDSVYIVATSKNNKLIKKERFFKGKLNGFSEYYYDNGVTKKVEFVLLSDYSILTNQIIYYDDNDGIIPDSSIFYLSDIKSDTIKFGQNLEVKFDVLQSDIDSFIIEYYFYHKNIDDDRLRIITPKKGQTNILLKEKISSDYKIGMNRIEGYARIKEFYADSSINKDSLKYFDIIISEKFYVE